MTTELLIKNLFLQLKHLTGNATAWLSKILGSQYAENFQITVESGMANSPDEPAHSVLSLEQCLAPKNMAVFPQLPYLPTLVHYDSFLFRKIKSQLQSNCFWNVTKMQE
jgi:hypothetical protein